MADPKDRWEDSAEGAFYVDKQCILCGVCTDVAPNNFKESEDGEHEICFKQPENDEEMAQCRQAMEECPVEAIGDDGAEA